MSLCIFIVPLWLEHSKSPDVVLEYIITVLIILALLYTWIFVDQLLPVYPPPLFILKSLSYLYFLCGQIDAVPE